jgi:uncharacterized protein (DUF427 family)
MSLSVGTGPFGHKPAGRFNVDVPRAGVLYVEGSPRWLRARRGGQVVLDSRRAKTLHETGRLARYYVPREDVRWEALEGVRPVEPPLGAPGLDGHVSFAWDDLDVWLEEDEELIAHAPDPYHRIDVRRSSRRVVVRRDDELLAATSQARALFETGLPVRWYLPREDVVAALTPSDVRTRCAYKGEAAYLGAAGAQNIAWTYPEPRHDARPVQGLVCFFNEHTDLELDGEPQERPRTPWAHPRWWEAEGPAR